MSAQTAAVMQIQQLLGATNGKIPLMRGALQGPRRLMGFGDDAVGLDPNTLANPYSNQPATSPPLIAVPDNNNTASTVGTAVGTLGRGLMNLFGQSQAQMPVVVAQPTPLWVYALVGIGGLAALGFVARSLRKPRRRAVAGYRRHHRR